MFKQGASALNFLKTVTKGAMGGLYKGQRFLGKGLHTTGKISNSLYNAKGVNMVKKITMKSTYTVGAAAMTGVAVMNGGMHAATQNMTDRYMRDSRYSSKLLQSRIGKGRNQSAMNLGNHTGLSLSLSKSRHGR